MTKVRIMSPDASQKTQQWDDRRMIQNYIEA